MKYKQIAIDIREKYLAVEKENIALREKLASAELGNEGAVLLMADMQRDFDAQAETLAATVDVLEQTRAERKRLAVMLNNTTYDIMADYDAEITALVAMWARDEGI